MSSGSSENEINGSLTDGCLWINHTFEPPADCTVSGPSSSSEAVLSVNGLAITGLPVFAGATADSGQSESVHLNNAEDCSTNEKVTQNTMEMCDTRRDSVEQNDDVGWHTVSHGLNNDCSLQQENDAAAVVDTMKNMENLSAATYLQHDVSDTVGNLDCINSILETAENQFMVSCDASVNVPNEQNSTDASPLHDQDYEDMGRDVNKSAEQCSLSDDACTLETDFCQESFRTRTRLSEFNV
jgi:hypothetical protein